MKVAIIGGGAAGFFSALSVKEHHPEAEVILFEKSQELLSKVRISGGGRCNVTNALSSISAFSKSYPRGAKFLKKAFQIFNNQDSIQWFESRGVPLKVEPDGRMFPISNKSESIVECLMNEAKKLGVQIEMGVSVGNIQPNQEQIEIDFIRGKEKPELFDRVIVASGGSPRRKGLEWLEELGHQIEEPVPSLFTFNMPKEDVVSLMGVSVQDVAVSIQGSKYRSSGPLLITHWGMSGPAILKLSAFAARELALRHYTFKAQISWIGFINQEEVLAELQKKVTAEPTKTCLKAKPFDFPQRFWAYLLHRCNLPENQLWGELGKKKLDKLISVLSNDIYEVQGKTTFKEEFVTCGGLALTEVDANMQSRRVSGLYFAGEILDIDGITGGFNFQAAWTTGYIAGQLKS
ncbi:MAG TPA: aminoacetone oxidase family FAD-binding enzyme [Flavobacteriales bacterium]|jgi:predicted Rossmann fold flavoprotein|nr:aminoacetone oxidase family FAD-binding enzyme [Flavobacteriales bacterium]